MAFENPIPVVVGLVPVCESNWLGLLVIRRAIPPGIGMLALPGGYLEMEPWRDGLTREVREETGLELKPADWNPVSFVSSEPSPNRLLLFAETYANGIGDIPAFTPNREVEEIGVVYRVDGLEDQFAFPLHYDQVREWLDGTDKRDAPVGFQPLRPIRKPNSR